MMKMGEIEKFTYSLRNVLLYKAKFMLSCTTTINRLEWVSGVWVSECVGNVSRALTQMDRNVAGNFYIIYEFTLSCGSTLLNLSV